MIKRKHTKMTKQKMSLSKKGHPVSDETKAKISKTLLGKKKSPATRAKMSKAKKGIPRPQWVKEKIRDSLMLRYEMRKAMNMPGRKMSKTQLAKHRAMLKRTKPWLHPNFKQGRKEYTFNRSQKTLLKNYLEPKKPRKRGVV